eukprot:7015533-Pyramimonas_sp.AAC.1
MTTKGAGKGPGKRWGRGRVDAASPRTSRSSGTGSGQVYSDTFGAPVLGDKVVCGSWNVKGLTDLKVFESMYHAPQYDLDVLSARATR